MPSAAPLLARRHLAWHTWARVPVGHGTAADPAQPADSRSALARTVIISGTTR